MRSILLLFVLFWGATFAARAQSPDLTIAATNFPAGTFNKGDRVSFSFTEKNIGAGAAGMSHVGIYLSPDFTYTNAVQIAQVSCKALFAGETAPETKCSVVLPYTVTSGAKYLLVKADASNEVAESNESNTFHSAGTITIGSATTIGQNLPYPIIFVHGFTSSNTTWDAMKADLQNVYGFSYGGNMNFCLNQDNSLTTSSLLADYHDWTDVNSLQPADFYTVNFDTDPLGNGILTSAISTALESNQAGIMKQGLAIRDAIKHVLQVTGKQKVILCGHSMGGLACREYIQNSAIWQGDGAHHVAKLTTLGTPHGGTDLTGAGLGSLGGLDEYSEAVRDMRTTYWWSGAPGVYLFGGKEKYSVMTFYPLFNYVNVDVNCNGIDNDGSTIVGINEKPMSADIAYTCVIGDASGSGDYVVSETSANLNNFRPVAADTFMVDAAHTSLTSQVDVNVKALDESKNAATAFAVAENIPYSGLFTQQSITAPSAADSDYFLVHLPGNASIRTELMNVPVENAVYKIYDANNNLKYSASTFGAGYADNTSPVFPAGDYYLNIAGMPDAGSATFPYSFRYNALNVVPVALIDFAAEAKNEFVQLSWRTASEAGLDHFEIERSADAINWKLLAQTTARNGGMDNNYAAVDSLPLPLNFYRLRVIHANGAYDFSAMRKIVFDTKTRNGFTISPNPARGLATLSFASSIARAEIRVTDLQGKQVIVGTVSGTSTTIDVSRLSSGIYFVEVNGVTEKLVVGR